ncbi:MerR family transcriptional regulator [Dyadobacter aurulentus]|uniref:MerR family transcriptional regulator n=1 Tax=Dyadobacter sp. UC 10 TaxID=2605428 RepID=UPI0011F23F6B|nr:MerR family transcriptional regulator [Dyadobacter sp. UC 10]KAA0991538.1 MerR family transcriptional regulator [Dyadobacter sp. UC 10]
MILYSVKKLARLAGVSVRTLHLYDRMGLLKPSVRTEARYRMYGEKELLRLQQILFYKELDFALQEILQILNDPDFDLIQALESHKSALKARKERIATLLVTVEKTIVKLKKGAMMNHEELYAGLPREKAEAYRKEAAEKWGSETVENAEKELGKLSKAEIAELMSESRRVAERLAVLSRENPEGPLVQTEIAKHYALIRRFWGTSGSPDQQAEAYAGLGQLYADDERYTLIDEKPNPEFAIFMRDAMRCFAEQNLK